MKKIGFILIMALIATSVFASGNSDDSDYDYGRGHGSMMGRQQFDDTELETYEGTLSISELDRPYIVVDGKTYLLQIPRGIEDLPELKEGDTVVIEGYTNEMRGFWNDEDVLHLMVFGGSLNGVEIEVDYDSEECEDFRRGPGRGRR